MSLLSWGRLLYAYSKISIYKVSCVLQINQILVHTLYVFPPFLVVIRAGKKFLLSIDLKRALYKKLFQTQIIAGTQIWLEF